MSYYVIELIMTLRDVVGWLGQGFRKKGSVRLGLFVGASWHNYQNSADCRDFSVTNTENKLITHYKYTLGLLLIITY